MKAVLALVAAAALSAFPLAAQSPADRAALVSLRDSLAAVTDTAALARLEAATIELAKQRRDDPLIHLRLGFIAYRLGELVRQKGHHENAAQEFEWAADLRPDWPYPWYGLGLAELALGEHAVIAIENLRQMLGRDYLSKATRAFARATEADPSFASAVVDLANTALAQRIRPRLEVALGAVRLAAASPAGRNAEVQLVRGRVEREAGEADSALVGFRAFLAAGGDSGVGLLEVARTQFLAHRIREGWRAYFDGVHAATSAPALTLYRTDLSWIADSAELGAFDRLPDPAARASWLEAFWTRRDVIEAREVGERLAEHYRRWFYAREHFRLVSRRRHYDITERYRSRQTDFDDRGVIYLRHGDPDRRARFICTQADDGRGEGCASNESWLYRRAPVERGAGGDLIFHFAARGDVQDFKLIESLVDVLGFRRAVRATSFADPEVSDLYGTRDEFGPLYNRVARSQRAPAGELAQDRAQGRRAIALGTTTDSYAQRFDLPLGVVASEFVAGAGTAPGAAPQALHVVFAIPGDRLVGERAADGFLYWLRFRLVVSDSAERVVAQVDTLRVFGARQPVRPPAYLTGRLAVALPPGRYRYRLLVATPDGAAGDLVHRDSVEVAALGGAAFAVSDVVLGREGSGLVWLPPGDTVRLNPLGRFPEGSAAELYYEVYGLERGAPYRTSVRLEREGGRSAFGAIRGLFGGGRAPVRLDFDAAADGPVSRQHRALDLRGVGKGNYRLTVVITNPASGESATRTRRFLVVDR